MNLQEIYENVKWTPVLEHWRSLKEKYVKIYGEKTILFYQVGTFFESYFEDALITSEITGQTLTSKDKSNPYSAPMSGSPVPTAKDRIKKCLEKGYTVILIEEVTLASQGEVKREVTDIFTPGTNLETVGSNRHNFICSIYHNFDQVAVILADVASNKYFKHQEKLDTFSYNEFKTKFIQTWRPKEVLEYDKSIVYDIDEIVKDQFLETNELKIVYCQLVTYLKEIYPDLQDLISLEFLIKSSEFSLDPTTIKNLEIFKSSNDDNNTLFNVINNTTTAFGSRYLEKVLLTPSTNINQINNRLDLVEFFKTSGLYKDVIYILSKFHDLERLLVRLVKPTCSPQDIYQISEDLYLIGELKNLMENYKETITIAKCIQNFNLIADGIQKILCSTCGLSSRDGGIINIGLNPTLDKLIEKTADKSTVYQRLQEKYIAETGFKCKVDENQTGVFIEFSNQLPLKDLPDHYIRTKSLKDVTRYITDELQDYYISRVENTSLRNELEYKIFNSFRLSLLPYIKTISNTLEVISEIDLLCSHAFTAIKYNYVRPELNNERKLTIIEGRHPVIENLVSFTSNNIEFNKSMLLVTGPNMGGKSTYLRQTGLLVLMTQIGSFLPCKSANIYPVDGIFTRVGASDNLSQGESTFYVEMSELSHILNNITSDSLVILDEVGRGTSTEDGESLAIGVIEYLGKRNVKTLFATHYHNLVRLEEDSQYIKNLHVDAYIDEETKQVKFTHRIEEGGANKSWGIEIAELAGLPKEIITYSRQKKNEYIKCKS